MTRAVLLTGSVLTGAALLIFAARAPSKDPSGSCVGCHEMYDRTDAFHNSTHRSVSCYDCHGGSVQMSNAVKLMKHSGDEVPEQVRLKHAHVVPVIEKCKSCHEQQFAEWKNGPHGITYKQIFLDPKHNRERPLMDDCLRCHGMHYEGGIRELVTPLDKKGPWQFKDASVTNDPAIPCLACHSIHRHGETAANRAVRSKDLVRPSLSLFDRRDMEPIAASVLPIPAMMDGARPVKMSPDKRQALCYQCHAANSTMQVGSGDDRTPMGVHEGISCEACHQKHGQDTRASCGTCHPKMSNCGRDVEKMDTTFAAKTSRHNIHFVKCADCHPKGVPKKPSLRAELR
jgi:hypothetical protein